MINGTLAKIAAIVLIILILFGLGWWFKRKIKDFFYAQIFAEQVDAAMQEQQKEIDRLHLIDEQKDAAISALRKKQKAQDVESKKIRAELEGLEDGPLSPVLRHALERLKLIEGRK